MGRKILNVSNSSTSAQKRKKSKGETVTGNNKLVLNHLSV